MRYWTPRKVPGKPRVSLVVASYLNDEPRRRASLLCLIQSLRAQTYANWDATVVHDGPLVGQTADEFRAADPRVVFAETAERVGKFGHPHRHKYACAAQGEFVGFANDDSYYAPVYFEWLLAELASRKLDLAYCDMVHSHQRWRAFHTGPVRGRIDIGCFLARRSLVAITPWKDHSFRGDGIYFEALAKRAAKKVAKVPALLYVHN
jgi:hypothetical protein